MSIGRVGLLTTVGAVALAIAGAASLTNQSPVHAQLVKQATLTSQQLVRVQKLGGQFVLESGMERAALRKAVAAVLVGESVQGRAERAKVEAILHPAARVQFAVDNATPTAARMTLSEGGARVSAPLSGAVVSVQRAALRQNGYTLSQQLDGTTLVQVIVGAGVRQERRFTLNAAGTVLTLDVRLTGAKLSAPVVTKATYRRS